MYNLPEETNALLFAVNLEYLQGSQGMLTSILSDLAQLKGSSIPAATISARTSRIPAASVLCDITILLRCKNIAFSKA